MNDTKRREGSTWGTVGWLGLGVGLGLGMTVLRTWALRYGSEAALSAKHLDKWSVARVLDSEVLPCVLIGVATAFLLSILLGARKPMPVRLLASVLAVLATTGIAVAGGVWSSAAHVVALAYLASSPALPWIIGFIVLGTGAAVLMSARPMRSPVPALALLIAGIAGALYLPTGFERTLQVEAPAMQIRDVRRDLLLGGSEFKVIDSHPDLPPSVGLINPHSRPTQSMSALPSLIMAPPCEVEFEIAPEDGTVQLRTAVTIDHTAPFRRKPIGFEITRNGEPVYSTEMAVDNAENKRPRTWRRPRERLVFEPGDKLGLRTFMVDVKRDAAAKREAFVAGFGELLLEYVEQRPRQHASAETPNILFLVQDTLRADALSCYGNEEGATPVIDLLASRGVRYENGYASASWTWPSTASMLTGLLPEAHGVVDDDACYLAEGFETLPELLQRAGYTTAAFTCNPLIVREKNFDQGFEFFNGDHTRFRETTEVLGDILHWIDRNASSRFFLYLHLTDPHAPHIPLPQYRSKYAADAPTNVQEVQKLIKEYQTKLNRGTARNGDGTPKEWPFPEPHLEWFRGLYQACVSTGDHHIGTILERLAYHGIDDETVVVFTSDHGEEWYDHGLMMHGNTLHRELTKVPLIIAGPGIPEGLVVDDPVSNRHLTPTLLDIAGTTIDGIPAPLSLLDVDRLRGKDLHLATEHGWAGRGRQPFYGIRREKWMLHFAPEGTWWGTSIPGGWWRLYDLEADPLEQVDLSEQQPELSVSLRDAIIENIEIQAAIRPNVQLETGDDTLEMLRKIGYLMDE